MVAALLAGLAVLLAWDTGDHRLVRRLEGAAAPGLVDENGGVRSWALGASHRIGVLLGVLAAVVVGGVVAGHRGVACTLLVAIGAGTGRELWSRARRRKRADGERHAVVRASQVLAGLLRVGAIPATALATVAAEQPVLADAGAIQAVGGDVVQALRRSSEVPGREGLADLASAWEVAGRTGASLCDSIEAVATELGRREETERTVRVELASARMAGRVLAVLPLVGLPLGYALGSDPLRFLFSGVMGESCLVLAAALTAGGLLWLDTLAERAMR